MIPVWAKKSARMQAPANFSLSNPRASEGCFRRDDAAYHDQRFPPQNLARMGKKVSPDASTSK
jgi:hypothetical protein